ncbi:hypothetical protein, partial [Staphylococcus pasteuri]|uniref:hypothetical protein n=1 Tax=Staphylococcus pasteuri TaxID=45972 RepID=UPI0016499D0C
LHHRIIAKKAALTSISKALNQPRTPLKHPKPPIPTFIFLPPTPLAKTQLPPPLPQSIFAQHHPIIPVHITQFIQKH